MEDKIEFKQDIPKIKLIKGQRDNYGWEITLPHADLSQAVDRLKEIDEKLKKEFMLSI